MWFFFFQAEDGIRDLVRSRGLGDVYKRQEERGVGHDGAGDRDPLLLSAGELPGEVVHAVLELSLIHI